MDGPSRLALPTTVSRARGLAIQRTLNHEVSDMTVSRHKYGRTWEYDFWWKGVRYRGSTGQLTKRDAELFEASYKLRLRQELGGIAPADASRTPRFSDWAEIYFEHMSARVGRPEVIADHLRVVLRFWGSAPRARAIAGEPYHDLRLADPIVDPLWLERFDAWMTRRGVAAQTRNHYRSTMSGMYRLALTPAYRRRIGLTQNPFLGIPREHTVERTVTLTHEQLRALLAEASYHVRLAVAIGALAPKLRLENILSLRWSKHIDPDVRWITRAEHKTVRVTRRPLVVPIGDQLRAILLDARTRGDARGNARTSDFVVTYRGRPVRSIRDGLRLAAARARLTYGRGRDNGLTFHTLRHTAATLLAELGLQEALRKEVMGHRDITTTQRYTHIRPLPQRAAIEALSNALPIADLVTHPRTRAGTIAIGAATGTTTGTTRVTPTKSRSNTRNAETTRTPLSTPQPLE
jgi:integrase